MDKQDLVYTRTASALEQKLGTRKKFSQVLGELDETRDDVKLLKAYLDDKLSNVYSEITRTASEITQKVEDLDTDVKAELKLKVGVDDNDQVVSMINASAEVIELKANRLIVESDNFSISEDGSISATSGDIGGLSIERSMLRTPTGLYSTYVFTQTDGSQYTYSGYLFYQFTPAGIIASLHVANDINSTQIIGVLLSSGVTIHYAL